MSNEPEQSMRDFVWHNSTSSLTQLLENAESREPSSIYKRVALTIVLILSLCIIMIAVLFIYIIPKGQDPSHMLNICPSDKWLYYNKTNFCYKVY
uniref:Uncharacterized protein n=1 Tax=Acrobeloides nanus TaxID=290746 RepID=A0A914E1U3_9BILA